MNNNIYKKKIGLNKEIENNRTVRYFFIYLPQLYIFG